MTEQCPHAYQYQWVYMGGCLNRRVLTCVYCGHIAGYGGTMPAHTPRQVQDNSGRTTVYFTECAICGARL